MDHISNYLNFSPGGDPNDSNKSRGVPIFDDLPLDNLEPATESSAQSGSLPASGPSVSDGRSIDPTMVDVLELKKRLYALKDEVASIIRLLEITDGKFPLSTSPMLAAPVAVKQTVGGDKIVEGVFSGEKMIGPEGEEYAVPPNYASKSKLVEGDHMKLTITHFGKFIYKQIGPIERKRIIGILSFDEGSQLWSVTHEDKAYKILTASATFYHGKPGDHVVILVPKDAPSSWGAVENIMAS